MIWQAKDAAEATKGKIFSSWVGGKLVFDSRLVEKGDTFIALPGANVDGHNFVKLALEKGAAAAIVSKIPEGVSAEKLLLVDDCIKALSDMANYNRARSKAKFIAVTGSVGKTSTKELLGLAFSAYGKTFISRGNYNNFLGVPINLASIPEDTEYAVIEIGMDHAGEITPLTKMTKPDTAIITAIENIHRANFDSIEGIAEAKAEIFDGLKKSGTAIINFLSNCYDLLKDKARDFNVIRLGKDSFIKEYEVKNNHTNTTLNVLGKEIKLNIDNIVGQHQIHNMLVALTCVASLNLDPAKSAKILESFKLPRGRGMVLKLNMNNKNIILMDDSYNAGPASVKAALKTMSYYTGRKIAILGDMVDMGPDSLAIHLDLKNDILSYKIDKVICFGQEMQHLQKALPIEVQYGSYLNLKDLAQDLPEKLLDGDVLLIKGSFYLTKLYHFTQHLIDGTLDKVTY